MNFDWLIADLHDTVQTEGNGKKARLHNVLETRVSEVTHSLRKADMKT